MSEYNKKDKQDENIRDDAKSSPQKENATATDKAILTDVKLSFAEDLFFEESEADEGTLAIPGNKKSDTPKDIPSALPILPVRDVVIFDYMLLPLFVGREISLEAVEAALSAKRYLFILTQKDEAIEVPTPQDMQSIGTVVSIMRVLKMPDGRLKILVQGISRAEALEISNDQGYLQSTIKLLPDMEVPLSVEAEALMRAVREQGEKVFQFRGTHNPEALAILSSIEQPGRLADLMATHLRLKTQDAQELLECLNPILRLELAHKHLAKELELASMQVQIQESAREGMDKAQKDYFLREQMKAIKHELGESSSVADELNELASAIAKVGLSIEVKNEGNKQLKRLSTMNNDSAEYSVISTYLQWLIELPWSKGSKDVLNIKKAQQILDADHYGLEKVKDRILEFLSVRKLNSKTKGPILCFVGPPGVGKTSLGQSIAHAMGRKFHRTSLGGMRDEAEIRGHRRTYVGAMPGRIIQALKQVGSNNPVIMLDEIDKIGADFRGNPSAALLEVLDPKQNFAFSDHYLNVVFDLSKVMFICTANSLETIPAPLRDRMEIITLSGYTQQEKLSIAKRYLIERQIKENGLKKGDIVFEDQVIQKLISEYTREAGLRNLEREIGSICRKFTRKKAEGEKAPFLVNLEKLNATLGAPRYLDEELEENLQPGVATGLAWTPYGGEILFIEVSTMTGNGQLILTGHLGDVMKESAQAAVSYARAHAKELCISSDFYQNLDIHIHVPAGAILKDGPSAGVTMATALVSALSAKAVYPKLCMTGEITLRGNVLVVGGIKEKIIAAVGRGLTDVAIPKANLKDLEEIPEELRKQIKIHPVNSLDEIFELAFGTVCVGSKKPSSKKPSSKKPSSKKTK